MYFQFQRGRATRAKPKTNKHVMFVPTVKMELVATTDVSQISALLLNIIAKS